MQQFFRWPKLLLLATTYIIFTSSFSVAQGIQNRIVSVNVTRKPLGVVLQSVSEQAKFVFSYNSNLISNDSLVTISATQKTVKQVLDLLFNGSLQYKESGEFLILQHPPSGPTFTVSGFVIDQQTGKRLSNVSVYEKDQLISTLTNDQGYFRLRLKMKDKFPVATVTISKELYLDTAIVTSPAMVQDLTVPIRSAPMITLKPVDVTQSVEKTKMGKFLLSSRQRMQSVNLKFLMDKPYQYSLVPGLGTHGKMSSQVVNRFSFNLLGGYGAGLNGVEIAGAFNIDKGNVRSVQFANLFNIVGGRVNGLQIAGIYNQVFDTVKGVQIGGIANTVKDEMSGLQIATASNLVQGHFNGLQLSGVGSFDRKSFHGMQAAGVINLVSRYAVGLQLAGILNIVKDSTHGAQIAGIGNQTRKTLEGVQLATFFNYARKVKGVQIALVNVADTSSGVSLGLVNYIRTGYHKLSIFSTELLPFNVAYRSGTHGFYGILTAGIERGDQKAWSTGWGMGHVFVMGPRLNVTTELLIQSIYRDKVDNMVHVYRFDPAFEWQPFKKLGFFAGPSLALCNRNNTPPPAGYKTLPLASSFNIGNRLSGWFGFHAGINIF